MYKRQALNSGYEGKLGAGRIDAFAFLDCLGTRAPTLTPVPSASPTSEPSAAPTATPVPSSSPCGAYSVSGAQYQTTRMGTYIASGECDGKTLYECVDCSGPDNELYYNAEGQWWLIGPGGCGSTSVGLYASGSGPPELASQWREWSGSDFVETSTITVGCGTFAPTANPTVTFAPTTPAPSPLSLIHI